MKDYPAFLVLIKTDNEKFIALFVDSKFEHTGGMEFEANGKKRKGAKLTNK